MARYFEFTVDISADKFQAYYRSQARYLLVYTDAGLKLQLPAQNFRSYISSSGIQGRFRVLIDESNKLLELEKMGELD